MSESLNSGSISTQLERVAELARKHPERAFMSLHHVIDVEWLREAYRRTRKDAAVGVDGQTYGFRPGRSAHAAHAALDALWQGVMSIGGGWVLEVDIQSFFDTLDHGALRGFLDKRVSDGVIRRGNWVVERTTMRARFTRALAAVRDWCRAHRHLPIAVQCKALGQKLRGTSGTTASPATRRRSGAWRTR